MNKKVLLGIMALFVVIIAFLLLRQLLASSSLCNNGVCDSGEKQTCSHDCGNRTANPGVLKSEVKIIDGIPRILINGKDSITFVTDIDYTPTLSGRDAGANNSYKNGDWLVGVESVIDNMTVYGVNTLVLHVFWSDMDTSAARPSDLVAALDFTPLDEVMDYAKQNGIYIILNPKIDTFQPSWWKTENGFSKDFNPCIPQEKGSTSSCIPNEIAPPGSNRTCSVPKDELYCCNIDRGPHGNETQLDSDRLPKCMPIQDNGRATKYAQCTDCETDSFGWKYTNPSIGSELFKTDYSTYLTAVITRYRGHPALIGWSTSLGPSGEDQYGPSHIALGFNVYGGIPGSSANQAPKPGQVVDYSDSAQANFRTWIRAKYSSDSQLQQAWNDSSVSLSTVKLPDYRKLYKTGHDEFYFPDDWSLGFSTSLDVLSGRGMDLYEFREHMRDADRDYFTGLIKGLDGNHVLGYYGFNNEGMYNNPNIDFLPGNNRIQDGQQAYEESDLVAATILMGRKHGKAFASGMEDVLTVEPTEANLEAHKALLMRAFKVMKCLGGYPGYVSGIPSMPAPAWSAKDLEVLSELGSYNPEENCICELVPPNCKIWGTTPMSQVVAMFGLQAYYPCTNNGVCTISGGSDNPTNGGGLTPEQKTCMDACTKQYSDPVKCSKDCNVII